jgi:hypothetical protein
MQGREFAGGMGYRWGFGSQECDNELSGRGNSYTAEFWQYDSRLGRRWNVDPVIKNWQSNYTVLSCSPIWRIDPLGADDYFNGQGQLIKQTSTGSRIYIQTASSTTLFSQLPMNSLYNRQTAANIVGHYAQQVGINTVVGVSNYPNDFKNTAMAFTRGSEIYVNARKDGIGISGHFDDYHNLKSGLIHEKDHRDKGHGFTQISSFEHAEVYLEQVNDVTYKLTTQEFKKSMAGSIASQLKAAAYEEMRGGLADFTRLNTLIETFNEQSDKTGYTFSLKQTKSGFSNPDLYEYEVYAKPNQK